MELWEAIRNRRTVRKFNNQDVSIDTINELLERSVWAPYHDRNEPWRFIVVKGKAKSRYANEALNCFDETKQKQYEKYIKSYADNVSFGIFIVIEKKGSPILDDIAIASSSALIQNFQLLAWEKGIGVNWLTHDYFEHEGFRKAFEINSDERIVAFICGGYFDDFESDVSRKPAISLITYLDK